MIPASSPGETSSSSTVEAALLGPPHLHSQHHLRPVLGVGPAGARVDRHQRVAGVVPAGEQPLLLELVEALLYGPDLVLELAGDVRVLLGQLGERLEVLDVPLELTVHRQPLAGARVLGPDLRRSLLVVPEAGLPHLVLERLDAPC